MFSRRNSSSVIRNFNDISLLDRYRYILTVTGKSLVYRIVNDFVYKMIKPAHRC